ncbi:MAG: pyridoxamine 5'-phosphate oxidase family protein [Chloroflexota bacterium]
MDQRLRAAEAYVLAVRTGEVPATAAAAKHIASDVVLNGATVWGRQGSTLNGKDDVVYRITGEWPNTPVMVKGFWSEPRLEGDKAKVDATFPAMGAAPAAMHLTFSFNGKQEISVIDQEIVPQPRPEPTETIPDSVRGLINGALRNNTPMTVAYVDEDGKPSLSLRGSVQVCSPTQLSIWVRNKAGGMGKALAKNPNVALLYRDSYSRSTLSIQGVAHQEEDPAICERVWDLIQDVEQKHETRESGCALIIDVKKIQGGTPKGGVRFQRA